MKMKNKILIILIATIAVLAIGSFSFAKVESVGGGNCSIISSVGEYTELTTNVIANPSAAVYEIVNNENEWTVNIYKYHIGPSGVILDTPRLTKNDNDNLSLSAGQSYLIEGAKLGKIDIDFDSLDDGTSLVKTHHNIKINTTKRNIDVDNIIAPVVKLNPNSDNMNVNITPYYQLGMNTEPIINDLNVYLEFKCLS
jgi:hypothetical protein